MYGNFNNCLKLVLEHEGGFVNHPDDPGGMTNLGVTAKVWADWKFLDDVSEEMMRGLSEVDVAPLYRANFWNRIKGDHLPKGLDYAVFDYAVNSGVQRAARCLQSLVDVMQDGEIGPKTTAAVNAEDPVVLIRELCAERLKFLQRLSHFRTFGRGWTKRVNDVQAAAEKMAG